jgi:YhcH/YjgK/YiaL family protein
MAFLGSMETVRAQAPKTELFARAWSYAELLLRPHSAVHQRVLSLQRGDSQKHELGDGLFAIEQVYDTKPRADGFFESHRKYIDIQIVIAGAETMELADVARAAVCKPYDPDRDLIVYEDITEASHLRIKAGEVTVFFPVDVHMPSLRVGNEAVLVRKSVVKVPVHS